VRRKRPVYMIGRATYPTRVSFYEGKEPVPVFIPDPSFGLHPTSIAAKHAFAELMEPCMKGATDDYIRRWCRKDFVNLKHFKVIKV